MHRIGKYPDGLALARSVVEDARATAYPPVVAETILQVGLLEDARGEEETEDSLREAYTIAIEARYDRVAICASICSYLRAREGHARVTRGSREGHARAT